MAWANTARGLIEIDSGDWFGRATAVIPEDEAIALAFVGPDLYVGWAGADEGGTDAGAVWVLAGGEGW